MGHNKDKDKSKPDASLVIRGAAEMTPAQRTKVASWLRRHAVALQGDGMVYSPAFRGRIWLKGETAGERKAPN